MESQMYLYDIYILETGSGDLNTCPALLRMVTGPTRLPCTSVSLFSQHRYSPTECIWWDNDISCAQNVPVCMRRTQLRYGDRSSVLISHLLKSERQSYVDWKCRTDVWSP